MTLDLAALTFAADEPLVLVDFWAGLLRWRPVDDWADGLALEPTDDTGFRLRFAPARQPKDTKNPAHFDLTSATPEQQQVTVTRVLKLGGRHIDVGQRPEEGHVVLADPDGNELCVIEAGNRFLDGCGFLGAVSCDGTQEVGYFWSSALAWPLVWDQGQETAIRSPRGGPKITWGGWRYRHKTGVNRVHFDLRTHGDLDAEVDRLLELGASRADIGLGDVDWAVLRDPDGNEFCLWPGR